ncbi:hypothetical protein [Asticcacaulis sp.]|uniref:hypothetical protein n=1 Tax=Asticcacaulis sp. TaxID=1872648 RepID=UPI0031D6B4BF
MTETMREVLRRLESTFRPEISDEMLLAVYLEVSNYDEPDVDNVFSDIHEEVRRTIMERMGAEDPDAVCGGIPYDYPAQGAEALSSLGALDLPPEMLIFIFKLTAEASGRHHEWQTLHDICRERILRQTRLLKSTDELPKPKLQNAPNAVKRFKDQSY